MSILNLIAGGVMETLKVCKICGQEKFIGDFGLNKDSEDGFKDYCKICWSTLREDAKEKKKLLEIEKLKIAEETATKKKQEQEKIKQEEEYLILCEQREKEDALKCEQRKKEDKLKREKIQKEYVKFRNKQKLIERKLTLERKMKLNYKKKWEDKLKPIIKEIEFELEKEKCEIRGIYKAKKDVRHTVGRFFISKNSSKKKLKKINKTEKILGCSFEEFKLYLTSKFEPWMNWNNHGCYTGNKYETWQLDHIVPLTLAKSFEDIIKLNHYTNFQPLDSYINVKEKRDKLNWGEVPVLNKTFINCGENCELNQLQI